MRQIAPLHASNWQNPAMIFPDFPRPEFSAGWRVEGRFASGSAGSQETAAATSIHPIRDGKPVP
jgi:hypothetical protein